MKIMIVLCMMVLMSAMSLAFAGGDGTSSNPYQISNCIELQNISQNTTAYYELINDIDCSDTKNWNNGSGFEPFNFGSDDYYGGSFCHGALYGNYNVIKNLYANNSGASTFGGLFRNLHNAEIRNFGLKNISIEGDRYVGGLAGSYYPDSPDCNVDNLFVNGYVKSNNDNSNVGGLFGSTMITSTDSGSYVSNVWGNVSVRSPQGFTSLGGIVGDLTDVDLQNVFSYGHIQADAGGGLIGDSYGANCAYCYYDKNETTTNDTTLGSTPLTTEEAKIKSNFDGFDFNNVWNIENGSSYPYLQWETTPVPFISPNYNIRTNESNYTFFFNVTHPENKSTQCQILIDGVSNSTWEIYSLNLTNNFSRSFEPGLHSIKVQCDDGEYIGTTKEILYDYDNRTPFIQSGQPSFFNTTTYASSPITIYGNASDRALNLINITVFYPNGSIYWNNLTNVSNETDLYEWNENLDVGNQSDGVWKLQVEASDNVEVSDLPGLNPTTQNATFEVDACDENFTCVEYGDCTEMNLKYCEEVEDTSGCNETYEGDMSEFTQTCTYSGDSSGGGGGFPFSDDEEQQETTNATEDNATAFAAAGEGTAEKPSVLENIPIYAWVLGGMVLLVSYMYWTEAKRSNKKGKKKRK